MAVLEVSELRKSFEDLVAVDGVSFEVNAGEVFGLLGPNGAGKSTTMMMIAGLVRPDSGEILLEGNQFTAEKRELRHLIGVVPQDLAIYEDMTALENLMFFGSLYGVRGQELKDRIEDTLQRIGLVDRAHDRAETFSGGMKRRLNFGAALLHKPHLLILDEPTVGVDPQSRSHLLDCIRNLNKEGVAIIYASHYMEEVEAICDRVAIIDHGQRIAYDHISALLSKVSADLKLKISPPQNGLMERLKGRASLETTALNENMLVISRLPEQRNEDLRAELSDVLNEIEKSNVELRGIDTEEPSLEKLFLDLTGKSLRD
ncbi:Daunorubicin/doxorubicin resistance ATP-binding protein DrrA [Polystyrenella longa]|uniref:Daunorubicin/doxorubicin resistance ATP-binding protein DrrA n=1 Tax=Polystyrenella longa TaxID=2528007 RepID=A0A518CJG9_9PLAN|nr:ABC transporter ATP-binding protein [Polystyrenella longa]QDU79372.1 Daunorubicin/doxorubicin resistance ATP-binding protein DrrA [Polystyrenella longa]